MSKQHPTAANQRPELELLIDYAEGLLSAEASARVEDWLAQHEEDAAIVEGIRWFLQENNNDRAALDAYLVQAGIKAQPDLADNAQEATETASEPPVLPLQPEPAEQQRRRVPTWVLMAASIALLATLGIVSSLGGGATPQTRASGYLAQAAYPAPTTWRDGELEDVSDLYQLYADGQYQAYTQGFETRFGDASARPPAEALLLQGICYLNLEAYKKAEAPLERAAESGARIEQAAKWHLALCLVLQEKTAAAKPLLETFKANKGSEYRQQAIDLLELIGEQP